MGEKGLFIASAEAVFPKPGGRPEVNEIGKEAVVLGKDKDVEGEVSVD